MTGDIEWDLLADYAGGALDGTPQAAEVAQLIATEPAWARAYAELTAADPMIVSGLAALGAAAPNMPADVAARLDDALAEVYPNRRSTVSGTPVASLADARRRRWTRGAGIAAIAAGVLALGAFVVPTLRPGPAQPANSSAGDLSVQNAPSLAEDTSKRAAPDGAAPPAAESPLTILASGFDYRRDTVTSTLPGRAGVTGLATPSAPVPAAVPFELTRLTGPAALSDCLAAITAQYGGRVISVDLARFEGAAALVARITTPAQVVVAGPSCGLAAAGADVRFHAAVN